jgi:hypothetical protein
MQPAAAGIHRMTMNSTASQCSQSAATVVVASAITAASVSGTLEPMAATRRPTGKRAGPTTTPGSSRCSVGSTSSEPPATVAMTRVDRHQELVCVRTI